MRCVPHVIGSIFISQNTHLCPLSKSIKIQPFWSLTASTLLHWLVLLIVFFFDQMSMRCSTNWDRKGWPGLEIQIYYGCPWVDYILPSECSIWKYRNHILPNTIKTSVSDILFQTTMFNVVLWIFFVTRVNFRFFTNRVVSSRFSFSGHPFSKICCIKGK